MAALLSRDREALDALFARTTGTSKLGLERTTALLDLLGNPHRQYPMLHVAGTNGKGSVVAMLGAMLQVAGRRVGSYTSPHLVDFRERIVVSGAQIPGDYVTDFLERWMPAIERTGATFFEATTAMAFAYFAHAGVDVAVIETGLGGRLDATNVITPLVAGVTSIALDHREYLGDTLEQIAFEKAGIFKAGVPAIIGEPTETVRQVLADAARDRGAAPIVLVAEATPVRDVVVTSEGTRFSLRLHGEWHECVVPLVGRFQAQNAAVALGMLDACGAPWCPGVHAATIALGHTNLPGRFQRYGKYIFDVAHNPDGIRVLADTLRQVDVPRPLVVVLTVLADKDWRAMMDVLAGVADSFVLTSAPTAPASRAWQPEDAAAYAAQHGWSATVVADFGDALRVAEGGGATVVVTGSFHTVGDALALGNFR